MVVNLRLKAGFGGIKTALTRARSIFIGFFSLRIACGSVARDILVIAHNKFALSYTYTTYIPGKDRAIGSNLASFVGIRLFSLLIWVTMVFLGLKVVYICNYLLRKLLSPSLLHYYSTTIGGKYA